MRKFKLLSLCQVVYFTLRRSSTFSREHEKMNTYNKVATDLKHFITEPSLLRVLLPVWAELNGDTFCRFIRNRNLKNGVCGNVLLCSTPSTSIIIITITNNQISFISGWCTDLFTMRKCEESKPFDACHLL